MANYIYGNNSSNTLFGDSNYSDLNDAIYGYGGDDYLYGFQGSDTIHGGEGDDAVVGYQDNDYLYGDGGNDVLGDSYHGEPGDDYLNGGTGNDTMYGGTGNDTYVVDAWGDSVNENPGAGTDWVFSSISHSLSANVENLYLTGTAYYGVGNDLDNLIYGNSANNYLDGYGGDDRLYGLSGDDYLYGGLGNDSLYGGTDNDTLYGERGNDLLSGDAGSDRLNGYGYSANYADAQIDQLIGGSGSDTFVLGGWWGASYVESGDGYGVIQDWDPRSGFWGGIFDTEYDRIEVKGTAAQYRLEFTSVGGIGSGATDTEIYYNDPTHGWDRIGIVQDSTNVSLARDFVFV